MRNEYGQHEPARQAMEWILDFPLPPQSAHASHEAESASVACRTVLSLPFTGAPSPAAAGTVPDLTEEACR